MIARGSRWTWSQATEQGGDRGEVDHALAVQVFDLIVLGEPTRPAGNLLTKTDGGGQVTYTYTPADNLATVSDPQHAQTSFTYDVDAQQTKVSYPNGVSENTQFDQSGQLTRIWGTNSGGSTLTSSTYNFTNPSTGLPTAQRYSITDAAGNVTNYTYDSLSRLTQGIQKNSGGTQLASYLYVYDPVGNMTSKTINGTTTTMAFNAADELTSAGSATYSYDANGNQTGVSGGNAFTYNAKDQTASITPNGGSAISMAYRGRGQAQRLTAGTTSYQYDVTGLSQSSSGSPVYYTTTPNGEVLSERLSTGTYYYLHDGLGSVIALTNGSGSVVNSYAYDPYGNTTSSSGTVANPFRYIGAVWDSQTGLYKMGERYYDPSVGRFTQPDPLGGGYGYADGNPINFADPSGLRRSPTIHSHAGETGRHTVWRSDPDGNIHCVTFARNPRSGYVHKIRSYNSVGRDHGGVPTPHVQRPIKPWGSRTRATPAGAQDLPENYLGTERAGSVYEAGAAGAVIRQIDESL